MARLEEESASNVEDVLDQDAGSRRNSLIPPPLRPSLTNSRPKRPPRRQNPPSPTVFVSLRYAEPFRPVSGQLSLHKYRKFLASPQIHPQQSIPPRILRRKPKAGNLHSLGFLPRTSHSPSSSPSLSSLNSSAASLVDDLTPLEPPSIEGHSEFGVSTRQLSATPVREKHHNPREENLISTRDRLKEPLAECKPLVSLP